MRQLRRIEIMKYPIKSFFDYRDMSVFPVKWLSQRLHELPRPKLY